MNKKILVGMMLAMLAGCGGEPGTQTTPAAPQTQPAPTERGVLIGDSITYLWDLTQIWPASLNAGVMAQISSQILARFDDAVLDVHPAVVVILAGTNDILYVEHPTVDNIAAMAEHASAAGIRVIIGTLPPDELYGNGTLPTTQAERRQKIMDFNSQLRMLAAAHGYTVADYYPQMVSADGLQDTSLFKDDRVHPNTAGYSVMWSVLRPLL